MAAREDAWLARVLGRPVFVADEPEESEPNGFYYAKRPVDAVAEVARFTQAGFCVVDVNVTLARGGGGSHQQPDVVVAQDAHADDVLAIAEGCFRYSRFHLDPAIGDELAGAVKREWVRSYVEGTRGEELLVALREGRPAGFLAVLASGDDRVIDLIGVAGAEQRSGVGDALVTAFLARHGDAPRVRVGTQIANVPSLRLYAKHGFAIESAQYVLHKHVA